MDSNTTPTIIYVNLYATLQIAKIVQIPHAVNAKMDIFFIKIFAFLIFAASITAQFVIQLIPVLSAKSIILIITHPIYASLFAFRKTQIASHAQVQPCVECVSLASLLILPHLFVLLFARLRTVTPALQVRLVFLAGRVIY